MFKRIKHAWMVLIGRAAIRQIFDKKSSSFDHELWKTSKSAEYIPQTPVAALPRVEYVKLIPMHAKFLCNLLEDEESRTQYSRRGYYKYNGWPIYCLQVHDRVFRFKFHTITGINYTDCVSETMAGALVRLAKVLNHIEKLPPVFNGEPKNECRFNPS